MIAHWTFVVMAGMVITWSLLPLLRSDEWWIRMFEFPRVQIGAIGAATFIGYVAFVGWRTPLDWLLLGGVAACTAYQVARITRYSPLHPKQVHDAMRADEKEDILAVMVSNVLTPNRNAEALLRLVHQRKPDLVLTVETDAWWERHLDTLQPEYPYAVKQPLDNLYGMHLYSRLPLIDPQVHYLVEDGVPSIHARVRLRSGRVVDLFCLHPAPPSPTENETSAERDAELLLVATSLGKPVRATIVMGDLNDVAWSATTRMFQDLSGLLDPRIGRGTFSTFHARYPILRWPLDHVFCSPDFTLVSMERLPSIGSDHFPFAAVFKLDPAAVALHDEPEADADERETADEKIDKVGADRKALQ